MIRPISHFEDLRTIAAARGLAARTFVPVAPARGAEILEQLPPDAVLAHVADRAGRRLDITAAMLLEHIAATSPEHHRHLASWLAVAHLRCLVTDPEHLR